MGIYVFDAAYLYQLLEEDQEDQLSRRDFGMDIIPKVVPGAGPMPTLWLLLCA